MYTKNRGYVCDHCGADGIEIAIKRVDGYLIRVKLRLKLTDCQASTVIVCPKCRRVIYSETNDVKEGEVLEI